MMKKGLVNIVGTMTAIILLLPSCENDNITLQDPNDLHQESIDENTDDSLVNTESPKENEDTVVVDSYTEDYVEPDTIIGEIENNENDMKVNNSAEESSLSISVPSEDEFDFHYDAAIDGAVITKYNGNEKEIRLPEKLGDDPVKGISEGAFKYVKYVEVPDTFTVIQSCAFKNCEYLERVVLPDSIIEIQEEAFSHCEKLEYVNIPEGIQSISEETFYYCRSLNGIVIPDGVTSIGERAFCECEALTEIRIPESVIDIGEDAFAWCYKLKNVVIPMGIEKIPDDMFSECRELEEVLIPDTVTTIGKRAFNGCKMMESIQIPEGVTQIGCYAFGDSGLKSIIIPSGVTIIDEGLFTGCDMLEEVILHDNIKEISEYSFNDCIKLRELDIPDGVERISSLAFAFGCEGLTVTYKGKKYNYTNIDEITSRW